MHHALLRNTSMFQVFPKPSQPPPSPLPPSTTQSSQFLQALSAKPISPSSFALQLDDPSKNLPSYSQPPAPESASAFHPNAIFQSSSVIDLSTHPYTHYNR